MFRAGLLLSISTAPPELVHSRPPITAPWCARQGPASAQQQPLCCCWSLWLRLCAACSQAVLAPAALIITGTNPVDSMVSYR